MEIFLNKDFWRKANRIHRVYPMEDLGTGRWWDNVHYGIVQFVQSYRDQLEDHYETEKLNNVFRIDIFSGTSSKSLESKIGTKKSPLPIKEELSELICTFLTYWSQSSKERKNWNFRIVTLSEFMDQSQRKKLVEHPKNASNLIIADKQFWESKQLTKGQIQRKLVSYYLRLDSWKNKLIEVVANDFHEPPEKNIVVVTNPDENVHLENLISEATNYERSLINIMGAGGAGKSTLLFHIAKLMSEDYVVIIPNQLQQNFFDDLKRIVNTYKIDVPILILIDNAKEHFEVLQNTWSIFEILGNRRTCFILVERDSRYPGPNTFFRFARAFEYVRTIRHSLGHNQSHRIFSRFFEYLTKSNKLSQDSIQIQKKAFSIFTRTQRLSISERLFSVLFELTDTESIPFEFDWHDWSIIIEQTGQSQFIHLYTAVCCFYQFGLALPISFCDLFKNQYGFDSLDVIEFMINARKESPIRLEENTLIVRHEMLAKLYFKYDKNHQAKASIFFEWYLDNLHVQPAMYLFRNFHRLTEFKNSFLGRLVSDEKRERFFLNYLKQSHDDISEKTKTITELAVLYRNQKRQEEYKILLQKTIDNHPEDEHAYTMLGNYYLKKREVEKSHEVFTDLLRNFPESAYSYFNLGKLFYETKKEGYLDYLVKALEIDQNLSTNIFALLSGEDSIRIVEELLKVKSLHSSIGNAISAVTNVDDAFNLLSIAHNEGIAFNYNTFNHLIKNSKSVEGGLNVIEFMDKNMKQPTIHQFHYAVDLVKDEIEIELIENTRNTFGVELDHQYINKLSSCYKGVSQALKYIDSIAAKYPFVPDNYTLNTLLKKIESLDQAVEFKTKYCELWSLDPDVISYNILLRKCSNVLERRSILKAMIEDQVPPNFVSMIVLATKIDDYYEVIQLMKDFKNICDLYPEQPFYNKLIQLSPSYTTAKTWKQQLEKDFESDIFTFNALLSRCENNDHVIEVLNELNSNKEIEYDHYTYNILLEKSKSWEEALSIHSKYKESKLEMVPEYYSQWIKAFANSGYHLKIFEQMRIDRVKPNIYIYNQMIHLAGDIDEAKKWLIELEKKFKPNHPTIGALLGQCNNYEAAMEIIKEMKNKYDIDPNEIIYNILIKLSPNWSQAVKHFNDLINSRLTFSSWSLNALLSHVRNSDQLTSWIRIYKESNKKGQIVKLNEQINDRLYYKFKDLVNSRNYARLLGLIQQLGLDIFSKCLNLVFPNMNAVELFKRLSSIKSTSKKSNIIKSL